MGSEQIMRPERSDKMSRFQKLSVEVFLTDETVRNYLTNRYTTLSVGDFTPARRGGAFYGKFAEAPAAMGKYGIILPRGGMIFPEQTAEELNSIGKAFIKCWKALEESKSSERSRLYIQEKTNGRLNDYAAGSVFIGKVLSARLISHADYEVPMRLVELDDLCTECGWSELQICGLISQIQREIQESGFPIRSNVVVEIAGEQMPLGFSFGNYNAPRYMLIAEVVSGKKSFDCLVKKFAELVELARTGYMTTRGNLVGYTRKDDPVVSENKYVGEEMIPFDVLKYIKKSEIIEE